MSFMALVYLRRILKYGKLKKKVFLDVLAYHKNLEKFLITFLLVMKMT